MLFNTLLTLQTFTKGAKEAVLALLPYRFATFFFKSTWSSELDL